MGATLPARRGRGVAVTRASVTLKPRDCGDDFRYMSTSILGASRQRDEAEERQRGADADTRGEGWVGKSYTALRSTRKPGRLAVLNVFKRISSALAEGWQGYFLPIGSATVARREVACGATHSDARAERRAPGR